MVENHSQRRTISRNRNKIHIAFVYHIGYTYRHYDDDKRENWPFNLPDTTREGHDAS